MTHTVAIIGGGITGLTAAYRLKVFKNQNNLPIKIILCESSNRLGGVIKSEAAKDFIIEHGPDAFLCEKPELKNLLDELDLTSQLLSTNKQNRQAFVARKDKLIPLPVGFFMIAPTKWLPFIFSPLFSVAGKLRIALETVLPKRKTQNDESVSNFLQRRFGSELSERVGQPLVGGIYMADINLLSAQSTLSQFTSLEQKYGSIINGLVKSDHRGTNTATGARYNLFCSLKNGIQTLIDKLAEQLTDVSIRLNTKILSINKDQHDKWQLHTENDQLQADAIILALPANIAASIVNPADSQLSDALSTIGNSHSVVINLLYKRSDIIRPYRGFGFVVPAIERKKIIAGGFISQKFDYRANHDHEMIRVFIGGQLAPELYRLNDKELIDIAQAEIANYLKIKNPPTQTWLSHHLQGLPLYKIGHQEIVEKIENYAKQRSGLFFAGSSYYGIGIPDCVRSGERTAIMVSDFIKQKDSLCLSQI